jgi:hypothetical protein
MQSVFSPATRRNNVQGEAEIVASRVGGLKTD